MTINRTIGPNGAITDEVILSEAESIAVDHCHEMLKKRFEERGEPYTREHEKMCEWWLLSLLRYEGLEKMVYMAEKAPFPRRKRLVAIGYSLVRETEERRMT